jgi:hypothetical protein
MTETGSSAPVAIPFRSKNCPAYSRVAARSFRSARARAPLLLCCAYHSRIEPRSLRGSCMAANKVTAVHWVPGLSVPTTFRAALPSRGGSFLESRSSSSNGRHCIRRGTKSVVARLFLRKRNLARSGTVSDAAQRCNARRAAFVCHDSGTLPQDIADSAILPGTGHEPINRRKNS